MLYHTIILLILYIIFYFIAIISSLQNLPLCKNITLHNNAIIGSV